MTFISYYIWKGDEMIFDCRPERRWCFK